MTRQKAITLLTAFSCLKATSAQEDSIIAPINPKCLEIDDGKLAGFKNGDFQSDQQILEENSRTDYRLNAFQICTSEANRQGTMTGFRLITAPELGNAIGFQDGVILGLGDENCKRYAITNAASDPII